MTSTSATPTGSWNPDPVQRAQAGTGHFMLTLCRLAAPVSIRPFQSPRLQPFKFFMSRTRQPDGSEHLYLHMGYFETLAEAETWVAAVRRHYPNAFATIASAKDESLTDTQVLKILETRRISAAQDDVEERNCDRIELLRPDDTGTRQALKEAVVRGAPVYFAVQLHWSAQPIDLSRVPSLAIFKAYTLYATETHRQGRSPRYFLRLGFFPDPISAKQVAVQVRSNFASAAVVPVLEEEITRARAAAIGTAAVPYLLEQPLDRGIDSNGTPGSPTESEPLSNAPRSVSQDSETVQQTRELRAGRQISAAPDSLSDSGVRHLRVEVQEHSTGRWRKIRLGATPSDLVHYS
jgi:hypothetical protein